VRICKQLIPGQDKRPAAVTQFLDDKLLKVPSIALTQAAKEVVGTGDLAAQMLTWSRTALLEMDETAIQQVLDCEAHRIDPLCAAIEQFLNRLLRGHLNEAERRRCFQLKNLVTDVERVADLAENIAQAGQERLQEHVVFSSEAQDELYGLHTLVCEVWGKAVRALEKGDKTLAGMVVEGEEHIDILQREAREAHNRRLECGLCKPKADTVFIETLRNLERVGDHADNLGVSVLRN
jgi:phosphate:Na+ symporter